MVVLLLNPNPGMPELKIEDLKLNTKPVPFVKLCNTIKFQISSTKLQINLKSQYSMTQTFTNIAARHDVKSGEPGKMLLSAMPGGSSVWIFEFG